MALSFPRDWPERAPILEVFTAALAAVDPEQAVAVALERMPMDRPLTIVAIGKAAPAMARGVPGPAAGIIVSDHVEPVPDGFSSHIGGHPIPDERSRAAGEAVIALIDATDGPILFLISGGSSALCELPVPGLEIEDLASVTASLLRSGADIVEMNTVRKHLSQIKGGRLAERAADRPARSLLISDVVGDPVHAIGSGPTVPDPTTFAQAGAILARYGIPVPGPVAAVLEAGVRGEIPESLKVRIESHEVNVVANASMAARAAAAAAERLDVPARIQTIGLSGDAETAARRSLESVDVGGMTFFAGETTVAVTGPGLGGRNQHAALAAAILLEGESEHIRFGTLATDGVDGPTDGAGAVVDGESVARGRAAGLSAREHLAGYDSHPFLEASGDLLRIGPSGTNVGDLWVVWR